MAMGITKFFRKYNKAMLAVFTAFLMIVFLLPVALKEMFQPDPTKQVIGEAFGSRLYRYDVGQTKAETDVLDYLSQYLYSVSPNPQQVQAFNWQVFTQFGPENERLLNYTLLIREARNMGVQISMEQVDRAILDRRISADVVNQILSHLGIPLKTFRQAIVNFLAVESAFELAASAAKISDPELKYLYKLTSDRMKAEILPVPAAKFVKEIPQPSEKDLAAYFSTHQSEFAYPDRVQVEYLTIDLNQLKKDTPVSRERARQYWEEHKAEFVITTQPATAPATQKGTATAPASRPAPVQVQMTFEQALPKIIDKLKSERAADAANKVIFEIKRQADYPWLSAPVGKNGLKEKPQNVVDYQKLAEQVAKEFNVPVRYNRSPLVSREEAAVLPGIGASFLPSGQQRLPFSQYAFNVVPLITPPPPRSNAQPLILVPYQNNTGVLRREGPGQAVEAFYLFRVVQVDPKHLPEGLAEVKDKVTETYRLSQAFEVARKNARKICDAAGKDTLSALVKKPTPDLKKIITALDVKTVEPQTFARRTFAYGGRITPPFLMNVAGDPGRFVDAAFEKLWKQPTTQPNGVRTCSVVDDNQTRTAYAVQLLEKEPATAHEFEQFKPFLARFVLMSRQQEFAMNWFNAKSIHERAKFVSTLPEEEEGE